MPLNSFTSGRRTGRPAEALAPVSPVVQPPVEADLLLHRARNAAYAEAANGRLGRGLALLQDALDQEPMSHDLLADMAALLLAAGQYDRAIGYAQRALQRISHHGPSLYTLGFALAAQGQTEPAIEVLSRLTRGGPRDSLAAEAPDLLPLVDVELARLHAKLVD